MGFGDRFKNAFKKIGKAIKKAFDRIGDFFSGLLASIVSILFSIPGIGALLKWIWNLIKTAFWFIVNFLLDIFLFRVQKKMRICPIIIRDEGGTAPSAGEVENVLIEAHRILLRAARVRVIRERDEHKKKAWPTRKTYSDPEILDLPCDAALARFDLKVGGSRLNFLLNEHCWRNTIRRFLGWGAPVAVFFVRNIKGSDTGCSLGPLTDWVAVEYDVDGRTVAHELGHACNLRHRSGTNNLMKSTGTGDQLTRGQQRVLRSSRHVTFL